jgi:hypothetical protein
MVGDFIYTYLWQFYVIAVAVNAVFLYLYVMIKATKSANEKMKKAKEQFPSMNPSKYNMTETEQVVKEK